MVRKTVNASDSEPKQMKFLLPSEKEHLFQVVDVIENIDPNPDIVHVKLEVAGGDEEGRSILNRISLEENWKGFFATRLFLKAINEPYKGQGFAIDSDNWTGRMFNATVVHSKSKDGTKTYANIQEYDFNNMVKQVDAITPAASLAAPAPAVAAPAEVKAWDDNEG